MNTLPLHGVFLSLVCKGLRLSVRDYLEALRALRSGFGLNERRRLVWLCQTLWARNEEEARLIELEFQQIPLPTAAEVALAKGSTAPPVDPGRIDPERTDTGVDRTSREDAALDGADAADRMGAKIVEPAQVGAGLPRAHVVPTGGETFVLSCRSSLALRTCVAIWRRYRRAMRSGPKTELDISATIRARCLEGVLISPVLIPSRRNQAKLVVLVDASPSMLPWQSFCEVLVESLPHGQLGSYSVFYFDNVPDETLFRDRALLQPVRVEEALQECPQSPLLIVSDAGAARGFRNRERVRDTAQFWEVVAKQWGPIAWVNPMPRRRWVRTSAAEIAKDRRVASFEADEDELIKAIDVLRRVRV